MTKKHEWEGKVHGRGVVLELGMERKEFTIGVHGRYYYEFRFDPDKSNDHLEIVRDEGRPDNVGRLAQPHEILYYSIAGWSTKLGRFKDKPERMRSELMSLVKSDSEMSALVFEFHRFRDMVMDEYNARDRTMPNGKRKDQVTSWRPSVA